MDCAFSDDIFKILDDDIFSTYLNTFNSSNQLSNDLPKYSSNLVIGAF